MYLTNLSKIEMVSKTYKDIILLNSMPVTYKEVNNTIKYDTDTLSFEIIIDSLRQKEIEIKADR